MRGTDCWGQATRGHPNKFAGDRQQVRWGQTTRGHADKIAETGDPSLGIRRSALPSSSVPKDGNAGLRIFRTSGCDCEGQIAGDRQLEVTLGKDNSRSRKKDPRDWPTEPGHPQIGFAIRWQCPREHSVRAVNCATASSSTGNASSLMTEKTAKSLNTSGQTSRVIPIGRDTGRGDDFQRTTLGTDTSRSHDPLFRASVSEGRHPWIGFVMRRQLASPQRVEDQTRQ